MRQTPFAIATVTLLVLGAALIPAPTLASDGAVIISPGATWRYWDSTHYPGDAWRTLEFVDDDWKQGAAPLGFGDLNGLQPTTVVANNRQTTTYFRHAFVVTNASLFTQLGLSLQRDDGALVWLNNVELWRQNLPTGIPILPSTEASAVAGGTEESQWWTTNVLSTALQSGTNLLAIEVHQFGPQTSSDLGLDFSLEGLNDNARPTVTVPADYSLGEAPTTLQLAATVADDGNPLPSTPGNPDPQDPNQLRWGWSVVSAPATSAGVEWSGSPTNGQAFTYLGSAHAPGTVFTCDPTATFDVPGLYILEFSAGDGEKRAAQQVSVLVKSTGDYRQAGYLYLSPVPGAQHVAAQTRFILVRFSQVSPTLVTNLSSFIRVTGSRTGVHAGQTRIATDGRTVFFQMSTDFANDEMVTVTLNPMLPAGAGAGVEPYQYSFAVAGFLNTPESGTITARGQNAPNETKEMAFDALTQTKWTDLIVPDGVTNFTWIQRLYPGEDTHVVNAYALTSANDRSENDPSDWRFYGVDGQGNLTLLDARVDELFSGRFQERLFTITNVIAYRGFRLEISRVRDPGSAAATHLADLDWSEPAGSVLYEYWGGIEGDAVANLKSDPRYPGQPDGRQQLSSFEAPVDWAETYGARLRGYLTAPNTGSYVFWISSDDNSELWLSTDDSPTHARTIAYVSAWTASRVWDLYSSQKSAAIELEAGRRYYIEALHKEGIGGDNLAVGWAKPGQSATSPSEVIPGSVLSPWVLATPFAPNGAQPAGAGDGVSGSRIQPNGVSVPADFPQCVITASGNPAPGYLFLENAGQSGATYTMMLDNEGSAVWYRRGGGREFKKQKNGMITWSAFTGVDKNFKFVRNYYAANGHATDDHELEVLENGGYLVIGFHDQSGIDLTRYLSGASRSATVHATALQEFTAAGELIFQFRAWDHFEIRDVEPVVENPRAGNVRFSHMNAIDVDTDGHLLISSRHISEVTKINRDTGQIMWRLSGAHSDFRFLNDPLNGFRNQHDISALGNRRYMVFDNGNGHNPAVSRAVEYELDLTNKTATLVWEFRNQPDRFAYYMGNAQRLPNGNTLINFVLAGYPKITEVDTHGVKQLEMNLTPGSDLYRAFRFPWDGVVEAPYLIVEAYPDNVTLIFNKFGDHTVDHYRVYGGTTPQPTALVATSKATLLRLKNVVNGSRNYFRVTAFSTHGVESASSNEESLVVNIVKPGENMVLNGDFAGGTNTWTWSVSGSASAAWGIVNGAALLDLTNGGSALTDVHLRQAGLKLIQSREYVLEFEAWSPQPRVIEARLGQDQSPFASYKIASPSITPVVQHFAYPFVMTGANDLNARLTFNCGASPRGVYLDNVALWMVVPGDLNHDRRVDHADLAELTKQWLKTGSGLTADLTGDGKVSFEDLARMGENWTGAAAP